MSIPSNRTQDDDTEFLPCMKIAIVMPVLNESATLPARLEELAAYRHRGVDLIIIDGGSQDDTIEMIRAAGLAPLTSARGRARQMMTGAAKSDADVLLFLHADTTLPPSADRLILEALADGRHTWGRFDVHIAGRPWMLKLIATMMNLRSRLSGIATGDQAIFVTREAFDRAGGFPDQPLMEDIELSRRLRRLSRPACLRSKVVTSGRRWEQRGVWRTILLMWRLRWAYWRGAPPDTLARRYR